MCRLRLDGKAVIAARATDEDRDTLESAVELLRQLAES